MDLLPFLSAYFSDVIGWMSGIGSIAFTLLTIVRPAVNQKRAFGALAAVSFLVGSVHIWTIEHRARALAEDQNTPNIKLRLSVLGIGTVIVGAAENTKQTQITVELDVTNLGAASILKYRNMTVILPDGKRLRGQLIPKQVGSGIVLHGAPGVPDTTLPNSDYMVSKFANNAVAHGSGGGGWGSFVIRGVSPDDLLNAPNAQIEIECEDITGKILTASTTVVDSYNPNMYYPARPQ